MAFRIMKPQLVYVAPNRSHHFGYAEALHEAGMLAAFVSGYPRMKGAFASLAVPAEKVVHTDGGQLLYLAAGRAQLPRSIVHWCNRLSKRMMARALRRALRQADGALIYSGCGLEAMRAWRGQRWLGIEAVNTHLDTQRMLMERETARWESPPMPWDTVEMARRREEYALADYILGPSDFVLASFQEQGVTAPALLKNRYGCRVLPPVAPRTSTSDDRPVRLLYVGQLNIRKGLGYLLEAFAALPTGRVELWLVGPENPPTGLPAELPLGVELKGVLRGEALSAAYASADVFVQPSVEEGLSLVVGEAMHMGLPVVATVSSGAQELFADEGAGLLVPPADADALRGGLLRLVEDPAERRRMGAKAAQLAQGISSESESGRSLTQTLAAGWEAWR